MLAPLAQRSILRPRWNVARHRRGFFVPIIGSRRIQRRAVAGGGSATPTLLSHVAGLNNGVSVTTFAINTTGATLIVAAICTSNPSLAGSITDSVGNAWTQLTAFNRGGSGPSITLFYCSSPTTNASHTFTVSIAAGNTCSCCVAAFDGTYTTATPFEFEAGAGNNTGSIQPGSVTPSESGDLLVTALATQSFQTSQIAVDSGFTITDYGIVINAGSYGTILAYLVQGAATAINPTWTYLAGFTGTANIAVFKHA